MVKFLIDMRTCFKTDSRRLFLKKMSLISAALFCNPLITNLKANNNLRKKNRKKVVIIGSGLTGLCSGAILAKQGFNVTILEANPTFIGGHSRSYVFDNLAMCTGPQYVWNFNPGEIGDQVIRYLGIEETVKFVQMDKSSFENYILGNDDPFTVPMGFSEFEKHLQEVYPQFHESIQQFFSIIRILYQASKKLESKGLYLADRREIKRSIMLDLEMPIRQKRIVMKFSDATLSDLFNHCGLQGEIRRILYGHSGIFAENENEVSAVLYAAGTGSYHSGACVPEKGFISFIEALSDSVKQFGGRVLCGKTVNSIILEENKAKFVECKDGSKYKCDYVISNIAPRLTCGLIEKCQSEKYNYSPSNSLLSCFLVLSDANEINEKLKLRNFWWHDKDETADYNNPDMLRPPKMLYIGSPSANMKGFSADTTNASLVLFAPGNFKQSQQIYNEGNESYQALKETISDNVICILEKQLFPGIREKILFIKIETPLDINFLTGSENGNVYGRRLSPESILSTDLRTINQVRNLYIGCATVGLPGVATCFRTATLLCEKISKTAIFH